MTENTTDDLLMALFFAVFDPLPRQGPGSRESTLRALALCADLPPSPTVLDLGCGSGAQTLHLAAALEGATITAIDSHKASVERLEAEVRRRGLEGRVRARVGDMMEVGFEPRSVDLIWSEGALYNIGIEKALSLYQPVLKPGRYMAFTEAVWLRDEPAAEARAAFQDYAAMGSVRDVEEIIAASALALVDRFVLPDSDWWDAFYTPMEQRVEALRETHRGDAAALAALEQIAAEPAMRRRCAGDYGYAFFVVQA